MIAGQLVYVSKKQDEEVKYRQFLKMRLSI